MISRLGVPNMPFWHHAVAGRDFAAVLNQAASRWKISPVHHLFWRAEIQRACITVPALSLDPLAPPAVP
jgi:hypothetical protein